MDKKKAKAEAEAKTPLIYIGNDDFLPGVPARDLSEAEVKEHGGEKKLVQSGLYRRPAKPADQETR
jgi:hypothetical protein